MQREVDGLDLEAVRRAYGRARRLQELTAALAEHTDTARIAEAVGEQIMTALEANGAIVTMIDEVDPSTVHLVWSRGYGEEASRWSTFPLSADAPIAECLRSGKPVMVRDRAELVARFPAMATVVERVQNPSNASLPLRIDGRVVGAFGVSFREERQFDEDERAFLVACAHQCELALHRARLLEQERNRSRRLRLLADIATRTVRAEQVDPLLHEVADEVGRSLDATCVTFRISTDRQSLEAIGVYDADAEAQAQLADALRRSPPPAGSGFSGHVLATGEPLLIPHLTPDALLARLHPSHRAHFERYPARSAAIVPLRGGGQFVGVLTVARRTGPPLNRDDELLLVDVAERVALALTAAADRARVRTEQARLRSILEQVPSVIWMSRGPDHVFEFSNPPHRRAMGGRDVAGERVSEVVPGLVAVGGRAALDHVYRTGEPMQTSGSLARVSGPDGTLVDRYFDWTLLPMKDEAGRVEGLLGFAHDVTAKVEALQAAEAARQALQRTEERLRLAVESGAIGTWEYPLNSGETVWDARTRSLFGLSPNEPITREKVMARLHPDDREAVTRAEAAACDPSGPGRYDMVQRVVDPGGELRWVRVTGQALFDPARTRAIRMTGTAIDITEQKRTEEALQAARHSAEAGLRAKDQFLAMLGHELRNPLSPILTALKLIQLRGAGAHERECAIIERQVRHMAQLVDDLLDVSRITGGKVELRKRPVEISAFIGKAIEMASPLLEQRRHTLTTRVAGQGLWVLADENRLAQVVSNLLTNAAKYTEPGGRIDLSIDREGERGVIRVRDNGIGIAPDLLPRLFGLFVQGERSFDRSDGGLGLGLAIVRSLVEMHGGAVSVHSDGPGKGSTFAVFLPLAAEAFAPEAPKVAAQPGASSRDNVAGRAKRVLIVDDNHDAAETVAEAVRLGGHEVRVVHDGVQAVQMAAEFLPEIALVDLGLPVMDGFEVARRIRAESFGAAIRLVALTGYGQPRDRERTREAGFNQHLVKPVELDTLLGVVDS